MNLNQQLLAIHLTAGMGVKAARAVITAVTAVQVPTIYPWPWISFCLLVINAVII